MGIVLDMLSGKRFPLRVESTMMQPPFCPTGELRDVKVEASGAEGAVVGVAVGGFEIAGGVEGSRIPETASEVGEERELRP